MKFRFFSDIHLETDLASVKRPTIQDVWRPSVHSDDAQTVLILAGDIWNGVRPLMFANQSWMAQMSSRFRAVVVVLGNHDYWGANLNHLPGKWRRMIQDLSLSNVHLLELADGVDQGVVLIDGVRILGCTLWTNMGGSNPILQSRFDLDKSFDGRALWNDKNYIRVGTNSRFRASHWLQRHAITIQNLRAALALGQEDVLLVTHHAPCMLSAAPRGNDPMSSCLYGSDLSDLILDHPRIKQVIHGHTHVFHDYMMGDVRIRCNPRGYAPSDLVEQFDALSFAEI
jgi:predicted phosphohydrolase